MAAGRLIATMRPILLCLALLGACGGVGDRPRDPAAANDSAAADAEAGDEAVESAVQQRFSGPVC